MVVDEPLQGEFFGFASMLDQTPHQTNAIATQETVCIEVDRHDISVLLERKPHAGMDMLAVLGRQFHASQRLVRVRAARNPNEVIEEKETFGERIADHVASFGGSWTFIISFAVILITYASLSAGLGHRSWDPYPFILLNLVLSFQAAYASPIIMMSQNRQGERDRIQAQHDYECNLAAKEEIETLMTNLSTLEVQKIDRILECVEILMKERTARTAEVGKLASGSAI